MSPGTELAGRLIDALAAGDRDALAATLDPRVRLRALLPSRSVDLTGRDEAVAELLRWFAGVPEVAPEERTVTEIGDVVGFGFRFALRGVVGGERAVGQQGYATVTAGRMTTVCVICSGFRPVAPAPAPAAADLPRPARELDALGETCATLTPLISTALRGMAAGEVLAVRADDPAAAEGIGAWSRLTGHRLVATRPAPDGTRYYLRRS